jgi:sugar-specific transcriptional regulator TrmB
MNDAEITSLLEQLGLTEYEAKTLSTLFKMREAEAPDVSRLAQVPKTRVYDVLDRLIDKKLVIEINGRPKKYRVVESGNALTQLLESKKIELQALEKNTFALKSRLAESELATEEEGEKVMKVKDKNDFITILAQEIGNAKKEVVAMTKLDEHHPSLKDSIKQASNRKINVKFLAHTGQDTEKILKELGDAGIAAKSAKHGMNAFVIDGKKVILSLSELDKEKPEYHFTIWQNNPHMAKAIQNYFDEHWK